MNRTFAAGSVLQCYVEAYGAVKDPAIGAARVTQGYSLLNASGQVLRQETAVPMTQGEGGELMRPLAIPLARLAPGRYELALSYRDEITGSVRELREPFSVSQPLRPNLGLYSDLVRTYVEGDTVRAVARIARWSPKDLAEVVNAGVKQEDETWRRAALLMHTEAAIDLWRHGRSLEAGEHVAIGRTLLDEIRLPGVERDWLLLLGYSRQSVGFSGQAVDFYGEVMSLYPATADGWLGAGTAYEYTAYPDGLGGAQLRMSTDDAARAAKRLYREAARLDPTLAEARLRLGRLLQKSTRPDEAEREFAAAIETSREAYLTALAHLFWGQLAEARGDSTEAARHYQAAIHADRDCQPAALALSALLHSSGHPGEAAETLTPGLCAAQGAKTGPWLAYHLGLGRRYDAALAALRRQSLPPIAEPAP
jgi:tetratricopeptide (TPR) repeat protein